MAAERCATRRFGAPVMRSSMVEYLACRVGMFFFSEEGSS
jgi:hypothetical protein